ncbi:O-methyltransferase [Bacteroidota bacterium]
MSRLQENSKRLIKYIIFFFTSKSKRGFGIHSPFVFDFVRNVLNYTPRNQLFIKIEGIRKHLKSRKELIHLHAFGTRSKIHRNDLVQIGTLANYSSVSKKYGRLLHSIVHHYSPNTIIELGTSFGISTFYMACANDKTMIYTVEGETELVKIAKSNAEKLDLRNIQFINGIFLNEFEHLLAKAEFPLLIYIDGDHSYIHVLNYFNLALQYLKKEIILILDDINWSDEMTEAWKKIISSPAVKISIDLYKLGILFFNTGIHKQHFRFFY